MARKRKHTEPTQQAPQEQQPDETLTSDNTSNTTTSNTLYPVQTDSVQSSKDDAADQEAKLAAQMARLKKLKKLRSESERLNREDVKAEYRKKQENPREAVRIERKKEKAEKLLEKETVEMAGEDYARQRALHYTAEQVEAWNEKQQQKEKNANNAFTDYAQAQAKKYDKLVRELKPNLIEYAEQRAAVVATEGGESSFYRDADSLAYANPDGKPSREAVERLVQDLQKQEQARNKFSRRRAFDDDDEVTYINERNMQFNKKIARSYDKYTAEIKGNFERGTAL
ncbi:hypothetical protein SpCBS45565_g02784 [Spizellomyces sp. 'palustris']|nr:hypothetical protein SpCBS45565_g02784 [Spizellomyces sp. 'palustris']